MQQQAFEPGTSRAFGIFGLGPGSPGPLGGTLQPPPMHAFTATFDGSPPGIPAVSTAGMSPPGPIRHTVNAATEAKLPDTIRMPSHFAPGGTTLMVNPAYAKTGPFPQNILGPPNSGPPNVCGGPPNVPKQNVLGPSLTQQRIYSFEAKAAAAAKMGAVRLNWRTRHGHWDTKQRQARQSPCRMSTVVLRACGTPLSRF